MMTIRKFAVLAALTLTLGASTLAQAESAGQYIDDTAITTKVKASLFNDAQLKATDIKVETDQGVVKLSGNVGNKNQENEALSDASQINGVKSVRDLLTVQGM